MRALVLAVALLALPLAGCLGETLSTAATSEASLPRFDPAKTTLLRIPLTTKDGVKLDVVANVSQEALDAGEKLPVIVDIGPYFGNIGGPMGRYTAIDMRMSEYFVPRGYVFARASVRGTGDSTGCFDLGGKREQQDIHDIVEHLGTQPWSNGNVAAFGKSYDGTTTWQAAITKPPHLKTIVPISGISDWYRYTYYDGTVYPEEFLFEPYYYLLVDDEIDTGYEGFYVPRSPPEPAYYGKPSTLLNNTVRTCDGFLEHTRPNAQSTVTGDHDDPFWIERDYEARIRELDLPVFLVHGLQDWNVKPDHEVPLYNDLRGPKAMWLGQWAHDYPDINRHKAEWSRHDWNETLLVWFDHFLKGVDNDWERLAHVEVQDQLGAWRTDTAWPPADAVPVTAALTAEGALALAPGAARTVAFRDPTGAGYSTSGKAGGLAFVSAPLAQDVTLVGRPSADVKLHVDRAGGNLAVQLFDVAPDGSWTEIDHGMRDLRHRVSRDRGTPVTPGETFNTTVWLYPQELTVREGHRIGVAISAELPKWIMRSPLGAGGTYAIHLGEGGSSVSLLARAEDAEALRDALDGGAAGATELQRALVLARETVK